MPNWVQNEIIFENAIDEKVAALIRKLKLATESDVTVDDDSAPEVTEIGEPEPSIVAYQSLI